LNKLDRRNRQKINSVRIIIARDLDLRQNLLKNLSKQLKRFARYGDSDLRNLKKISLSVKYSIFADFASTVFRIVYTEFYDTHYIIESVQFENFLEIQKYFEQLYCENYNLEDKKDFFVQFQF